MKYITLYILLGYLSGCYSVEPEKTGMEGKPMPSFKLLLSDSITWMDTKEIPTGKPVVLLYFGPHCPYSRAQMEEIIEDIDKLKDISFYLFTNWPFSEMKQFYKHYQLSKYPNIIVGVDQKHFFADYYEVTGVPYTAIFDNEKKLNKAFVGKIYSKQIKQAAYK